MSVGYAMHPCAILWTRRRKYGCPCFADFLPCNAIVELRSVQRMWSLDVAATRLTWAHYLRIRQQVVLLALFEQVCDLRM